MIKKVSLLLVVMALLLAALPAFGAMSDVEFVKLCEKGTAQEIRTELFKKANPNAEDDDGVTALMRAAKYNTPDVVSILLKAGADVNAKHDEGTTALMWAAAYNTPEVISVLLKARADLNAKHDDGYTALMFAAAYNTPEAVSVLLKAGADFNAKHNDGVTALMAAAAQNNNPEVISVLLKAGADVNVRDKNGKTALEFAQEKGKTEAVKILEEVMTTAAQTGDPELQYQLGMKYATGDGVKQDDNKAIEWFRKAAEQGHEEAKKALSLYE